MQCSTDKCIAVWKGMNAICSTDKCNTVQYEQLQCGMKKCNAAWTTAMGYEEMQCSMNNCNAVWCGAQPCHEETTSIHLSPLPHCLSHEP
eukprot:1161968-Pelagomonas_calceolata.AAC.13